MCVFERSGDLPANLDLILCIECIVCGYKLQFCHIYTSISADGSISAVSHTKTDWAAWSAVALIPRPVDGGLCLGGNTGEMRLFDGLQWNAGNPAVIVWLKKLSAQECDLHSLSAVSLPLIVCERGKHRHAYRSNTLGLKAVILHICDIIVFASQPSKMKQI